MTAPTLEPEFDREWDEPDDWSGGCWTARLTGAWSTDGEGQSAWLSREWLLRERGEDWVLDAEEDEADRLRDEPSPSEALREAIGEDRREREEA